MCSNQIVSPEAERLRHQPLDLDMLVCLGTNPAWGKRISYLELKYVQAG
jgi:hypothetical protein